MFTCADVHGRGPGGWYSYGPWAGHYRPHNPANEQGSWPGPDKAFMGSMYDEMVSPNRWFRDARSLTTLLPGTADRGKLRPAEPDAPAPDWLQLGGLLRVAAHG